MYYIYNIKERAGFLLRAPDGDERYAVVDEGLPPPRRTSSAKTCKSNLLYN